MIEIKHKQTGHVLLRVNADSLEGANLTGAKLAGAKLSGFKINHACLRDVDLQGAELNRAEMIGTCLDGANLTHALLEAADLTDASLQKADLSRAQLSEATMRYAKLAGANLTQAQLIGANLSMADARANLRGANLQLADLRGANLTGANLQQADLFQADLSGAIMTKAVVAGARTQGAKMHGVINNEVASRVEATTRASIIRRNPTEQSNGFQLGGRVLVDCPFCNQHQEIPPQRVQHHSRCVTCKERFFVDQMGNAGQPRTAAPNQWTPELNSITMPHGDSPSWEWPRQLTKPLVGALMMLLVGGLLWRFWPTLSGTRHDIPQGLTARAKFVGQAFAAGDLNRVLAVSASGESELKTWFNEKRNIRWASAYENNPHAQVAAKVLFEDKANGRAGVVTDIRGGVPSGASAPLTVQLVTFWEQSGNEWLLDGESTVIGSLKPK